MNRRTTLLTAGLCAGLAAGLITTRLLRTPEEVTPLHFVAGQTDRYDVEWSTRATADLTGTAEFDVSSALYGSWTVTTVRVGDDGVEQRATLDRVRSLRVLADDEPLGITPDVLLGAVVVLQREPDGRLRDLRFAVDTPPAARNTLTGLARLFAVERSGDRERRTTYGRAADTWRGDQRVTERFIALDGAEGPVRGEGSAQIELSSDGELRGLSSRDTAAVHRDGRVVFDTDDTVHFRWTGSPAEAVPAVAHVASVPARSANHRGRALDWPSARVTAEVHAYEGGDAGPLMWGGAARVALEPALRHELAALATSPSTPHPRRELALDLLAHAPEGRGQDALVAALTELEDHPQLPAYLQRLAFVRQPRDGVTSYLHARLDDPRRAIARAARLTLGAVAAQHPDPDRALAPLRQPLPDDADDAAATLGALGNARQPDDVARLTAATRDERPRVRSAALHALRHTPDADALPSLRAGVADPHPGVQRAALVGLSTRALGGAELSAVAEEARAQRLHGANLGLVATTLAPSATDPLAREVLRSLLDHPNADAQLRARLRALLAR